MGFSSSGSPRSQMPWNSAPPYEQLQGVKLVIFLMNWEFQAAKKPRLWSMPPSCSRSWLPQTSHLSRRKHLLILGMMLKSRFCSLLRLPFLPQSWKWNTTPYERELLLEGTIFHWTMIMGGRVKRTSKIVTHRICPFPTAAHLIRFDAHLLGLA